MYQLHTPKRAKEPVTGLVFREIDGDWIGCVSDALEEDRPMIELNLDYVYHNDEFPEHNVVAETPEQKAKLLVSGWIDLWAKITCGLQNDESSDWLLSMIYEDEEFQKFLEKKARESILDEWDRDFFTEVREEIRALNMNLEI